MNQHYQAKADEHDQLALARRAQTETFADLATEQSDQLETLHPGTPDYSFAWTLLSLYQQASDAAAECARRHADLATDYRGAVLSDLAATA